MDCNVDLNGCFGFKINEVKECVDDVDTMIVGFVDGCVRCKNGRGGRR